MSWEAEVDKLREIQGVACAAMYDFQGRRWAGDEDLGMTSEEIEEFNKFFRQGSSYGKTSMTAHGEKYMIIAKDETWVQLRWRNVPLCVYKVDVERSPVYLICKGEEGAIAGEISDEMYEVWRYLTENGNV